MPQSPPDFATAANVLAASHSPAAITPQPDSRLGTCRFCDTPLRHSLVDLGQSPLCETFLTAEEVNRPETYYPLHALVCERCLLVQVEEHVSGDEIFGGEYAYFSSYSDSWLVHAKQYAEMITKRLGLTKDHQVIELASNDGYLLRNFVSAGIPALGVEPADNVAQAAMEKGVPTTVRFFGQETARELVREGYRADLMIANNVLAHVPDLRDFVAGMKIVLAEGGTATVEFPHLMSLMQNNQFDTIYQEHYCYFSLHSVSQVMKANGLTICDLEHLTTHGGSLRIYVRHSDDETQRVSDAVAEHQQREKEFGITDLSTYQDFARRVERVKDDLLLFLIHAKRAGKQVAGYGAPGKGNTLLNYCGIRGDLISYLVDRNPYKHGRYTPGTHIPIFPTEHLAETRPDYILILPWNLKDEISRQLAYTRDWGAKLAVLIPGLEVWCFGSRGSGLGERGAGGGIRRAAGRVVSHPAIVSGRVPALYQT